MYIGYRTRPDRACILLIPYPFTLAVYWKKICEYTNLQTQGIEPSLNLELTDIIKYFTWIPGTLWITPTLSEMILIKKPPFLIDAGRLWKAASPSRLSKMGTGHPFEMSWFLTIRSGLASMGGFEFYPHHRNGVRVKIREDRLACTEIGG